jgi:hypothetical protein
VNGDDCSAEWSGAREQPLSALLQPRIECELGRAAGDERRRRAVSSDAQMTEIDARRLLRRGTGTSGQE